jgi:hypothetical protein
MKDTSWREAIGSRELAENVACRTRAQTAAYQKFLEERGVLAEALFENLPLTDKATYLKASAFEELLGEDFAESFAVWHSSLEDVFRWSTCERLGSIWSPLRFRLRPAHSGRNAISCDGRWPLRS